jgi:hypothetical protein
MDSILDNSWQSEEVAFGCLDFVLLAVLWQWLGFVLPPRYLELRWYHSILRPVTHQWRTSNLVVLGCNLLLAFC